LKASDNAGDESPAYLKTAFSQPALKQLFPGM